MVSTSRLVESRPNFWYNSTVSPPLQKSDFLCWALQIGGIKLIKCFHQVIDCIVYSPHELDEAARRRFAKRLYIALPEQGARVDIIKRLLKNLAYSISDVDFEVIGQGTAGLLFVQHLFLLKSHLSCVGYSGADMRELCTEAAKEPIRELGDAIITAKQHEVDTTHSSNCFVYS